MNAAGPTEPYLLPKARCDQLLDVASAAHKLVQVAADSPEREACAEALAILFNKKPIGITAPNEKS
jgi:hypothetical protein